MKKDELAKLGNNIITEDLYNNDTSSSNLNKSNLSWIKFQFVEAENSKPLKGISIDVHMPDGKVVSKTTGADGMIEFYSIPNGIYKLSSKIKDKNLAKAYTFDKTVFKLTDKINTPPIPIEKGGFKYTVQKNESLSSIANLVYDEETLWPKILKANKAKIGPDKMLADGMTIFLPKITVHANSHDKAEDVTGAVLVNVDEYAIVGKADNDTLESLTRKTLSPCSWQQIAQLNWGPIDKHYYACDVIKQPNIIYLPRDWELKGLHDNQIHRIQIRKIQRHGLVDKIMKDAMTDPKIKVRRRSEWGNGVPNYEQFQLDWSHDTIVIHHSGDEVMGAKSALDIETKHLNEAKKPMNQRKTDGLDIGYHFLVEKDGTIREARGLLFKGSHVDLGNTKKIGILIMGDYKNSGFFDGVDELTETQMNGAKQLIKAIGKNIPTVIWLRGHKDFNYKRLKTGEIINDLSEDHTKCPGGVLYDQLIKLREVLISTKKSKK